MKVYISALLLIELMYSCSPFSTRSVASLDTIGNNLVPSDHSLTASTVLIFPQFVDIEELLEKGEANLDQSICTGTVIHKNVILTAAHCLNGQRFNNGKIEYSSLVKVYVIPNKVSINHQDILNAEIKLSYQKAIPNSTYDFTGTFGTMIFESRDIGLVHVEVDLTQYGSKPITLYDGKMSELIKKYQEVHIAGYGSKEGGEPYKLNSDKVNIKHLKYYKTDAINAEVVLKTNKKHGLVPGDSGGPTYVYDKDNNVIQIGINAYGVGKKEGRSTRVSYFKEWINTQLMKININPEEINWVKSL